MKDNLINFGEEKIMPNFSQNHGPKGRCPTCNAGSGIVKECVKCGQLGCAQKCMGGNPGKCPKCGSGCKISKVDPRAL